MPSRNYWARWFACPHIACFAILFTVAGCCCPSTWYDMQAYQTWNELEAAVNLTPAPSVQFGQDAKDTLAARTGVTFHLPLVFDHKKTTALVPGTMAAGKPVDPQKVKPFLKLGQEDDLLNLPGHKVTYEMVLGKDDLPIYCYLCVVEPGDSEYKQMKDDVLAALEKSHPAAAWQTKEVGEPSQTVEYLELPGTHAFARKPPLEADLRSGMLVIYAVQKEHANVLIAYRAPTDFAKEIGLLKAADNSIATIESKEPTAETPPAGGSETAGNYVLVPNTQVELVPPAGFKASASVNGFSKEGSPTQIVVQELATPFAATVATYNEASLSNDGTTLISSEDVQQDGRSGKLILVKKDDDEAWLLIFGDDSQTIVIFGELHDANDSATKEAVKKSLLSARVKK